MQQNIPGKGPLQTPPGQPAASSERNRLNLTLSDDVDGLLEHVSRVLGIGKAALVLQAVVHSLPGWLEQVQAVRKASRELSPSQHQGKKGR